MITQSAVRCLVVEGETRAALSPFVDYLALMPHLEISRKEGLPGDLGRFDVIVTAQSASTAADRPDLVDFAEAGGGWLALVDAQDLPLPEPLGVRPSFPGPETELRVIFENAGRPLAARLPDAIYVEGRSQFLEKRSEDVEVLLYADWRYRNEAVLTQRPLGRGKTACSTLQAYDHPVFQRILYRVLMALSGKAPAQRTLGVGLLGYPPWLGRHHGTGIGKTDGLRLEAVCDINPARQKAAREAFPHATLHASAEALIGDDRVDLVIIATPPDTHCCLSLLMMEAGRHVVCEKPLALSRLEAKQMTTAARRQNVHLSCHQNRRWDPDYKAIRQALSLGLVGDLFYLETFVGGFRHPCGYWHSHAPISGGLAFDWGGHYLDWIVSLIPSAPKAVMGSRQKRVWHDVTNADQERIQIRFEGGQEAEFIHSDIAAAPKPKWYLLGTKGAIVGDWIQAAALSADPLLYYREEPIPDTEMPPVLTLHRRRAGGPVSSQRLVLPPREPFGFYSNLADHLLIGEPLAAPLQDSMSVVAILEAAVRSAANGGRWEDFDA